MMAGLCKVIIIGNLGRDPEKRYSSEGKPITRFSVAATTRRRERDGEWADHTEWFSVTVFGNQAEALAERLTKGSRVFIEGRLESRNYETQNGAKGFSMDVIATETMILESKQQRAEEIGSDDYAAAPASTGSNSRPAQVGQQARRQEDASDLEDLPF